MYDILLSTPYSTRDQSDICSSALNCCMHCLANLWTFSIVCHLCSRPQLATRLLAHKIQSPQEWEAMQALLVS